MERKYTQEGGMEPLIVGTSECWANLVRRIHLIFLGPFEILPVLAWYLALLHFLTVGILPGRGYIFSNGIMIEIDCAVHQSTIFGYGMSQMARISDGLKEAHNSRSFQVTMGGTYRRWVCYKSAYTLARATKTNLLILKSYRCWVPFPGQCQ